MIFKLLISLILGAIAGWAANRIMSGESGSLLRNIIIGIVGSFIGTGLAGLFGISVTWFGNILLSIAGACLCIFVGRRLFSNELVKK